jgi:hypothetical protein
MQAAARRHRTSGSVRLGKSIRGLPVGDSRRKSSLAIWILAICIAVALILRFTQGTETHEDAQRSLPGADAFTKITVITA